MTFRLQVTKEVLTLFGVYRKETLRMDDVCNLSAALRIDRPFRDSYLHSVTDLGHDVAAGL